MLIHVNKTRHVQDMTCKTCLYSCKLFLHKGFKRMRVLHRATNEQPLSIHGSKWDREEGKKKVVVWKQHGIVQRFKRVYSPRRNSASRDMFPVEWCEKSERSIKEGVCWGSSRWVKKSRVEERKYEKWSWHEEGWKPVWKNFELREKCFTTGRRSTCVSEKVEEWE